MKKFQHEKEVSKSVKLALADLESAGAVCWFERLNAGKVRTEYGSWLHLCRPGTADFIAILPVTDGVIVYFIECKSDTGVKKPLQNKFKLNVESWGALYEIVTDVKQVRITVEKVTEFYKNKLNNIEFNP